MYFDLRSQGVRISYERENLKHTRQYSRNEILIQLHVVFLTLAVCKCMLNNSIPEFHFFLFKSSILVMVLTFYTYLIQ